MVRHSGRKHAGRPFCFSALAVAAALVSMASTTSTGFSVTVPRCTRRHLRSQDPCSIQIHVGPPEVPEVIRQSFAAALAAAVSAVIWAALPATVSARDGTISPPTCVAIVDAATNCPARTPMDATRNAETQLRFAEERLADAEKEKGATIKLGESQLGEPEMVQFWKDEVKRLDMNFKFLEGFRGGLITGSGQKGTSSKQSSRFVGRLAIEAPDVDQETKFWCEAIGMQRYATLPDGGALVAFGPPGIQKGEEGAFFGLEIKPLHRSSTAGSSQSSKGLRLSFVQTSTPALIRISRVVSTGGKLIDGYGYYGIQSPAGVQVRAYVDDRRDPVEFVALAVPAGKMDAESQYLQQLGLEPRGSYQLVTPPMQEWMPLLPDGNLLFAGGDPKQTVQVLLIPEPQESKPNLWESLQEQLGRGPSLLINADNSLGVDILDSKEKATLPISDVQNPQLTIYGPAGASTGTKQDKATNSGELQVLLRTVTEAG